ncbi:MAG: T9SS type A sorting domain-containing protein [Bacteroidales bacterium]|nr:T9SS type A sorting domain-containing protein [Bacteroidales bacterium]
MKTKLFFLFTLFFLSFSSFAQLPLIENFDNTNPDEMPIGWTLETTTYDWTVDDNNSYSGSNAIVNYYSSTEQKDGWFFTPGLYLESAKVYYIQFMLLAPGWDGTPEALELAVGDDASIVAMSELLWSDDNLLIPQYTLMTFAYTPSIDGTYFFGWHAFSDVNIDYIAVDDINIYEAPDVDVAIIKSLLPEADLLSSTPNPDLEVANFGASAESFDVVLSVTNGGNEIYTETVSVVDLDIGQSDILDFVGYEPIEEGEYIYNYSIEIDGDEYLSNNELSKTVNIIDGCEHVLSLSAPNLEMGWFGGSISVTTNSIPVLTNVTLLSGSSINYVFPSANDWDIDLYFDGVGDLPDDCYWEVYDGEGNLLIQGNGDAVGTPISQSTNGFCQEEISNIEIDNVSISIMPNPTNGHLNIIVDDNYLLEIIDVNGVIIDKLNISDREAVNVKNKGIYVFRFSNNKRVLTQKVIVE